MKCEGETSCLLEVELQFIVVQWEPADAVRGSSSFHPIFQPRLFDAKSLQWDVEEHLCSWRWRGCSSPWIILVLNSVIIFPFNTETPRRCVQVCLGISSFFSCGWSVPRYLPCTTDQELGKSKLLFFLMRPSRGCVLPAQTPEFIPWHCIYLAESLFFHALRLLCSRGVSAARIRGALDLQLVTHSPRKGAKLAWSHILAL